jgi:hypothetical protein
MATESAAQKAARAEIELFEKEVAPRYPLPLDKDDYGSYRDSRTYMTFQGFRYGLMLSIAAARDAALEEVAMRLNDEAKHSAYAAELQAVIRQMKAVR